MTFIIDIEKSSGNTKDLKQPKQFWAKRAMLDVSQYLTTNYITESQQYKHATGAKTDIKTSGTVQRTQLWIHAAWFLTKSPKTYNGEKTASSTNVAGKTRYLPVENRNYIYVFHPVHVSTQSALRTLI
jgi:hypothetical protein